MYRCVDVYVFVCLNSTLYWFNCASINAGIGLKGCMIWANTTIYVYSKIQTHTRTRARAHTHTHIQIYIYIYIYIYRERERERERKRERNVQCLTFSHTLSPRACVCVHVYVWRGLGKLLNMHVAFMCTYVIYILRWFILSRYLLSSYSATPVVEPWTICGEVDDAVLNTNRQSVQ